jgi:glucosamine-6-phosphate deaminase
MIQTGGWYPTGALDGSPCGTLTASLMKIQIARDRATMSLAAAEHAKASIRAAIARRGKARIVAATGASQLEFLRALTAMTAIDWGRVELFHLDEYAGLAENHPASFRRYLREHLVEKANIRSYHFLDGQSDLDAVRRRVGDALLQEEIDVLFAGIGENGHLAFNDPPADFNTTEPYIVVRLDDACRRQQVGEGWFASIDEVPDTAISMSIQQMLKAREMIVVVPDERKAAAVRESLEGEVTPAVPASILRRHPNVTIYLDEAAASLLSERFKAGITDRPA